MAPKTQREVEQKFDVPPDFALPPLDDLVGPDGRVDHDVVALASTYFDTTAADLLRCRIALRRRAGDADTGWQLKVPATDGTRTELRWPPDDETTPPAVLTALLQPFTDDQEVRPVVRLEVSRSRHRLRDAEGRLLVEVCLDNVRATGLGAAVRAPRWHEAEVELADGPVTLLTEIGERLLTAGAVSSTSRSKLARALLGIGNEGVGTPRTSAGAVLVDYIEQQDEVLIGGHFALLSDEPDAVHKTRVACRRLRSTLGTFTDCFDGNAARAFDTELRWYASQLGAVRDLDVMRTRLAAAAEQLPAELVVGPIVDQIDLRLSAERARRRADLLDTVNSPRYRALVLDAMRWRDDPPFTAAAGRPASTLNEAVDRMEKRLAKQLRQATRNDATDDQLHRARKTGKQVRYATEAATGAESSPLARLQDILGEFQDSVVAAELLRQLAATAGEHGEDTFTYGVLVAEQRQLADRARRAARGR